MERREFDTIPRMARTAPSYKGLTPASKRASAAARGSSNKADTRHEKLLRSALWKAGCRFRKNCRNLPGKPDVVFTKARLAIFCDGDFWHGKNWEQRKARLKKGANASYWVQKIERNMERDRKMTQLLEAEGWKVVRLWESDILEDTPGVVEPLLSLLAERGHLNGRVKP